MLKVGVGREEPWAKRGSGGGGGGGNNPASRNTLFKHRNTNINISFVNFQSFGIMWNCTKTTKLLQS